jgi:peptide/nickel transport system substrate-binding protein
VACTAPAGPLGTGASGSTPAQPAGKKRLVASMFSDPEGMQRLLTNPGGTGRAPGLEELQELVHAGAAYLDDQEVLQPRLVDAIPSAENGLWTVLPDGRMETRWQLKPGSVWHDGVPLTTEDFAFAVQLNGERGIGIVNPQQLSLIEAVETPDPRTILVHWKEPFIDADTLFTGTLAMPLPKHILEQPFQEDRGRILSHPYWRDEYVGLGPYRLRTWVPSSHILLEANDRYSLGRPRIDEIEVRLIQDINASFANLLAGTVDYPIASAGLGIEQAVQIREMTDQVRVALGDRLGGPQVINIQFINPSPPVLANVEFRRALLHAMDRQELNETINYGLGAVADAWLPPDHAYYPAVAGRVVRYGYDPRRATELVQGLGYARGQDGLFRDPAGQLIHLEFRTTEQVIINRRALYPIADNWKRIGLSVEPVVVPNQLIPDREYRAQYPAFEMLASGPGVEAVRVRQWHSASAALPENRFVGTNRGRYQNADLDAIIERYVSAIPRGERLALLGDLIHHQTDRVTLMTTFYIARASVLGAARLRGPTSDKVWNAHLWELD